ncbi:MAG: hypothetical protein KME31_05395 [Tolypothrix carrinoi HA7290-LM1]|nr:hypothetical protein [Tolypothrix carrinoi HA7290-LM1]
MPEWQDIPGVVYIPIADLPLHRVIGLVWRVGQEEEVSDRKECVCR